MHIMGILNVTPDSFSDGGEHFGSVEGAVSDALQMIADGADIIDIGGQSTRPGAKLATEAEELERVIPVVLGLKSALSANGGDVKISVDTMSAAVARVAIEAGADIINDVSAGRHDPKMAQLIARNPEILYIVMHNRGQGEGMKGEEYGDVVNDVLEELTRDIECIVLVGVKPQQIIIDPGPGFSKSTVELNFPLLARLEEFQQAIGEYKYPVLFAASRKRFLGELLTGTEGENDPKQRDIATAATSVIAYQKGAWGVRVHNVRATADAIKVAVIAKGLPRHFAPLSDVSMGDARVSEANKYQLNIKGLEYNATHGVNPDEKIHPQLFKVDIEAVLDSEILKTMDDNIENGISYAEFERVAKAVMLGEHRDLIETLALDIANSVLKLHGAISHVKVTLHKPNAPISAIFEDVSVAIEVSR